jgi:hypothetical protein
VRTRNGERTPRPACRTRCLLQAYVNFWKAVVVPCFEAGLRAAGRQAPETAALIDELFARLYKAAVAAPGPVHFPYAAVLLRRR